MNVTIACLFKASTCKESIADDVRLVTFTDGNTYAYGNVSTRAIINVLFNPDVSLGFWVNNNLLKSDRTELLNGDQFDYKKYTDVFTYRGNKYDKSKVELPAFV